MLKKLGGIIERRPSVIIFLIIIITIGFSLLLPSLEFKTDFNEFMPDDKIGLANDRVQQYFGVSQFPMFALIEKQNEDNVISPKSLRDMYEIEQKLNDHPKINSVLSITSFINQICFIEFGKTINECTDDQIQIAINDMFMDSKSGNKKIFSLNDPNEPIDYKRFPRLSKGETIDSADIKNCYISKNNETITFSFEVYDLVDLKETLRPALTKINVMEWYLEFENLIKPSEILDISYRISAHIEPKYPIWEIGKGVIANLREIFNHIRNRELLSSYKMEAYLWISPPDQTISFPIPLSTGNISLNGNRIDVEISRKEIGQYGIATQIGSFELPAKLSNFKAGIRYYQRGFLNKPGGRVVANLDYILDRFEKLQSRPILGIISSKILQRFGNITWEEFDQLFEIMEDTNLLPETIALKDIDSNWIYSDVIPDSGISKNEFFIIPYLFDDLQINALSFLSGDFEKTGKAEATLIIIELDLENAEYSELIGTNKDIINLFKEFDEEYNSISISVTGELVISSEVDKLTTEANLILGPAMFVMIILILFISFRRGSYIILPLIALLIAAIWLFGTMVLLGIAFSVLAVAIIPLILGLGVDYSVHFFHNYRSELLKGKTPVEAIKRSVLDIGTAIFLAWLTTFIAFMSFLTASLPPIRQFGILLALGITYTFITAITFLPSARILLDNRKTPKINIKLNGFVSKVTLSNIMKKISSIVMSHQKKILTIMVLLTVFFAIGAIQIERGFDMDQFVPKDNPAMELFDKMTEYFPFATTYQEYILIEGDVATVETLKGIAQTHKNAEDDTFVGRKQDGSVKITSIYSEIENAIKNNKSLINKFNIDEKTSIPRQDKDVKALFDYLYEGNIFDLGDVEISEFDMADFGTAQIGLVLYRNNSRYTATVIRYYLDASFQLEGNIQDDLEILSNEVKEDMVSYGDATAILTGNAEMQYNNTTNLTTSQFISTAISLLLAAIVLIITYKNPILGLIAMIPVCISIVWILGTMYYFGYILDILTITVTSMTIGIGIDYAIHATERFRLVADKTGDVDKAVCETISHTGGALLIAALTTALAFGILILAPIPPQQRFGIILAVTIIYAFLTSVLFLPLFLSIWAKKRKKRKGYIISPGSSDK